MENNLTRKRLLAFIIDFLIFSSIQGIYSVIIFFQHFDIDSQRLINLDVHELKMSISVFIIFILFCLKDTVNSSSIGKKIMKICIVDKSNKKANLFQLWLRNIFILLWPVELIVFFSNKDKRLGDILFNTKVVIKK